MEIRSVSRVILYLDFVFFFGGCDFLLDGLGSRAKSYFHHFSPPFGSRQSKLKDPLAKSRVLLEQMILKQTNRAQRQFSVKEK